MKSILHTVKTRRNVLLLFIFTVLSQVFFFKLITYNSEKRKISELELQHSYKVIQDIENIRYSIAETESVIQSYILTGDHQWKTSLAGIHGRIFRVLDETTTLEADAMQQKKLDLVKNAIQNKIAFQQKVVAADSITPALMDEMGYHGINRRLTVRIQSPLGLMVDRQQLLVQRRADANVETANQARLLTIFYAAFIYLFILYALWKLRNQVQQPGPAAKIENEEEAVLAQFTQENSFSSSIQSSFRGVFRINDGFKEDNQPEQRAGVVRILWSRPEISMGEIVDDQEFVLEDELMFALENELAFIQETVADQSFEQAIPAWKAAGLPEELTMHFNNGHDHFLGHAVNSHYFQQGPVFNRLPNSYIPAGDPSYRIDPLPLLPKSPATRLPSQEQPGFQLAELVQSVLAPLYVQAEENNIRLLHTLDPAIPGSLPGDPERLRKILTGLMENALRFTYKGYIQLTISALNITSEEVEVAFSVADTGKGIDSERMHDLLNGPDNHGLALAKKLVELQQSQMMIHSTPEDGTVCCFTNTFKFVSEL
jgi:CHASE3 domain sensor protein